MKFQKKIQMITLKMIFFIYQDLLHYQHRHISYQLTITGTYHLPFYILCTNTQLNFSFLYPNFWCRRNKARWPQLLLSRMSLPKSYTGALSQNVSLRGFTGIKGTGKYRRDNYYTVVYYLKFCIFNVSI